MRMGHGSGVFVGLLCALAWSAATFAADPGEAVGEVTRLQGDALVTHAGAVTTQLMRPDLPVYFQDRIETLAGSKIELRFKDGTVVTLGPKSILRVTEFVYSGANERRSAVLDMVQGVFRAIVRKLLPSSAFEVHTEQAIAAVRGTEWMGEVTATATALVTLEGAVAVRRTGPGAPSELVLAAGEGVDVKPGAPFRKKRWGQGRIDGLRERTTFGHMACMRCGPTEQPSSH
jgi:hypothetical protein